MKDEDKPIAWYLSEIDIRNMLDGVFEAMIKKLNTTLEDRVEEGRLGDSVN